MCLILVVVIFKVCYLFTQCSLQEGHSIYIGQCMIRMGPMINLLAVDPQGSGHKGLSLTDQQLIPTCEWVPQLQLFPQFRFSERFSCRIISLYNRLSPLLNGDPILSHLTRLNLLAVSRSKFENSLIIYKILLV